MSSNSVGLFMYAVLPAGQGRVDDLVGLAGAPIKAIKAGELAALVSEIPNQRIRPERRNIAAFEEVLRHLLAQNVTTLPMTFGVVADGERGVRALLETHHKALLDQIKSVEGKIEMGLFASWTAPNIFEYFVNRSKPLRQMRDHLYGGGKEPGRDQKIELGRLFEQVREAQREADTAQIVASLKEHWEVKTLASKTDTDVVNLACLIPRADRDAFDKAVHDIADRLDDTYTLRIDGPWPPHNFCTVRLSPAGAGVG